MKRAMPTYVTTEKTDWTQPTKNSNFITQFIDIVKERKFVYLYDEVANTYEINVQPVFIDSVVKPPTLFIISFVSASENISCIFTHSTLGTGTSVIWYHDGNSAYSPGQITSPIYVGSSNYEVTLPNFTIYFSTNLELVNGGVYGSDAQQYFVDSAHPGVNAIMAPLTNVSSLYSIVNGEVAIFTGNGKIIVLVRKTPNGTPAENGQWVAIYYADSPSIINPDTRHIDGFSPSGYVSLVEGYGFIFTTRGGSIFEVTLDVTQVSAILAAGSGPAPSNGIYSANIISVSTDPIIDTTVHIPASGLKAAGASMSRDGSTIFVLYTKLDGTSTGGFGINTYRQTTMVDSGIVSEFICIQSVAIPPTLIASPYIPSSVSAGNGRNLVLAANDAEFLSNGSGRALLYLMLTLDVFQSGSGVLSTYVPQLSLLGESRFVGSSVSPQGGPQYFLIPFASPPPSFTTPLAQGLEFYVVNYNVIDATKTPRDWKIFLTRYTQQPLDPSQTSMNWLPSKFINGTATASDSPPITTISSFS